MKRVVMAVCCALVGVPARAASPADFASTDAELKACLAKNGSTPGVDNCNAIATAVANRRLDDIYYGLVGALKHPRGRRTRATIPRYLSA